MSRLSSILAGTRIRAAASSLAAGLGLGSLFGGDGAASSVPVLGEMDNIMLVAIGLGAVIALGQLFDIQLG